MIIITEYIKQYIVVRKDVRTVTGRPVSAQKLAVMVAHASMAFLSNLVLGHDDNGRVVFDIDDETRSWLTGIFTKVLLEVKSLQALEKMVALSGISGILAWLRYLSV